MPNPSPAAFRLGLLLSLIVVLILGPPLTLAQTGQLATDEAALAQTVVPARDRLDLAQRLLGVDEVPPPPITPQREYAVGDVETFSVQNTDEGVFSIEARLVYTNDHLYMWVEVGHNANLTAIQQAADAFSTNVYQQTRAIFGSEASPGIDGDPKLHVLHASNLGTGIAAYYYSESQYPQEAVSTSNEREMFFVNLDTMSRYIGSPQYIGILTHEFQHMIHWAIDANEESWLNEGLSELATYIAGYGISGFTTSYLRRPHIQLTYWPQDDRGIIYGGAFLFTAYIWDRYGAEATRVLVTQEANGMESIQLMLDEIGATDPVSGQPMTVQQLFMDFALANYLQDPALASGQYGYQDEGLHSLPPANLTGTYRSPTDFKLDDTFLQQWATQYYQVRGDDTPQPWRLHFSGNETVPLLPVDPYGGRFAMWSNRMDNSDTRLTHPLDLTGVDTATLRFWTWYDIEENWDYAYVMVSVDGGASWDILPTARTTTANPHNTSYGPGYSGASGDWVQEEIDLSAYAGQEILLRFEYITDDATIENGFLLDDVSVPEIDFFEDFEGDLSDWTVEGWVPIQNRLRQTFALHMIEYADGEPTVTRLLTPDQAPQGQWDISLGGSTTQVVFMVTGFAPSTTETATFSLRLEPMPQSTSLKE